MQGGSHHRPLSWTAIWLVILYCSYVLGADKPPSCEFCTSVVTAIGVFALQNSTQQSVIEYVDNICTYLPQELITECDTLVSEETPRMIDLILQAESPTTVCQAIKLCKKQEIPEDVKLQTLTAQNSSDTCVICEFVVATLSGLVADASTEAALLLRVSQACDYLPAQNQTACVSLIKTYGSQVIGIVMQYATPGFICAKLDSC
jgi:saposin